MISLFIGFIQPTIVVVVIVNTVALLSQHFQCTKLIVNHILCKKTGVSATWFLQTFSGVDLTVNGSNDHDLSPLFIGDPEPDVGPTKVVRSEARGRHVHHKPISFFNVALKL